MNEWSSLSPVLQFSYFTFKQVEDWIRSKWRHK